MGFKVPSDIESLTRGIVGDMQFSLLSQIEPIHTFILTLLFQIPSLIRLWRSPSHSNLLHSVVLCGFSSFMFGWHVHEKAILMVLIPLRYSIYNIIQII
jgi:alpha-1,3-glucosyltransferase